VKVVASPLVTTFEQCLFCLCDELRTECQPSFKNFSKEITPTTAFKKLRFDRIDLLRSCNCIYNRGVVADRSPKKDRVNVQFG